MVFDPDGGFRVDPASLHHRHPVTPYAGRMLHGEETGDRILATVVTARWRYATLEVDWAEAAAEVRRLLLEAFAGHHSRSLQRTLFAMGEAVLAGRPEVAEVRMAMPNKHHLPVDLTPYGLRNTGEVFVATDRPYGLIEGIVTRDGAPPADAAWA